MIMIVIKHFQMNQSMASNNPQEVDMPLKP